MEHLFFFLGTVGTGVFIVGLLLAIGNYLIISAATPSKAGKYWVGILSLMVLGAVMGYGFADKLLTTTTIKSIILDMVVCVASFVLLITLSGIRKLVRPHHSSGDLVMGAITCLPLVGLAYGAILAWIIVM